jgi:hypothetical protein
MDLSGEKVSTRKPGPATDQDGGITKPQAKRMFALSGGNPDIVKAVLAAHGYERSDQVQKTEYNTVCKEIEAAKKEQEEKIAAAVDEKEAAGDGDQQAIE